jgi:AcrR family transcriptional regulator
MQGRPLTDSDREATRRRLVEVARSLIEAGGRDVCSLRGVAAAAGMSRSTPYSYFPDKDALIDAVRAHALNILSDRCEAAVLAAEDLPGRVRALGEAYLAFAFESPALYDLIFEPHQGGAEYAVAAARYRAVGEAPLEEARAAMSRILDGVMDAGTTTRSSTSCSGRTSGQTPRSGWRRGDGDEVGHARRRGFEGEGRRDPPRGLGYEAFAEP